jgi:hypothetical protein
MNLNRRKAIWIFGLVLALTMLITPQITAAQQSQQDQNTNHPYSNDNANNLMYQQGLSQGRADRTNNQAHQYRLQPNNADDRRSYESGYDQGYQTARDADRDADRDRSGQNDQYGTRAESNGNLATQNGFQDGANQGLQDRQAGHSSRATKHHDYKEGDRGYSSSFGSKEQFKASYRQAYIQGYEKGYNGQGSDHR